MLRQVKDLINLRLGAQDGDIGRVKDLYFDDQNWAVRYLIADTGTWLPGRRVLISPVALGEVVDNTVSVNLTRRQIEAAPSVDKDKPVSRQHETDYARYYGWPMYWYGPALWGPTPYPVYDRNVPPGTPADPMLHREQTADPHLRSVGEVTGYHLQARDQEIGHVEDFLVDDSDWAIRYLVVDTRNWLPGKKVLLAPQWIGEVNWERTCVSTDLTADAIRNAPEYDSTAEISRRYEEQLYRHYRRDGYWVQRQEALANR